MCYFKDSLALVLCTEEVVWYTMLIKFPYFVSSIKFPYFVCNSTYANECYCTPSALNKLETPENFASLACCHTT